MLYEEIHVTGVSSAIYKHLHSHVSQNPVICDVYVFIQMCNISKTSVTYDIYTTYIHIYAREPYVCKNKNIPKSS